MQPRTLPIDLPASPEVWNADCSDNHFASALDADRRVAAMALRERGRGILIGLVLAAVAMLGGVVAAYLLDTHWPIACDGTASAVTCSFRMIGGAP